MSLLSSKRIVLSYSITNVSVRFINYKCPGFDFQRFYFYLKCLIINVHCTNNTNPLVMYYHLLFLINIGMHIIYKLRKGIYRYLIKKIEFFFTYLYFIFYIECN